MGSPVRTEGWPVLGSAHLPYPASQDPSSLAHGPQDTGQQKGYPGMCCILLMTLHSPWRWGWPSVHLDSLAVVHLYHMESEAVDSTDRGHEASRGPIKATTLIHQHLREADPIEWDSGTSLGLAFVP